MSEALSFKCPSCGGTAFKLRQKPQSYKDFIGAPCNGCGTVLTEDEIKRQGREIIVKTTKDAFKRKRF